MNLTRPLVLAAALATITGCSTTTIRSVQEMESHNGSLVLKYGEAVLRQELFSTKLVSSEQKIATCEQSAEALECKTLNVTIDNKPLKYLK